MNDAPAAVAQLALSRQRLRRAMTGEPEPAPAGSPPSPPAARPWWDALRSLPGAGIAIEAAQQWWARHPMRTTTLVALNGAQAVIYPLARRHPLALVLGAFVLGAVLVRKRSWGGLIKPALFAGLLPQLLIASLKAQSHVGAPPADRAPPQART